MIRERGAAKESTKEARQELQNFLGAFAAKKEQEQKEKDEYIEKKIAQLDARRERQKARRQQKADMKEQEDARRIEEEQARMEAFRNAPLKVGEKVRVKSNGMVGEVTRVSAKAVTVNIGSITSKVQPQMLERITANEYKASVRESSRPVSMVNLSASIAERKLNFSTERDVRGERVGDALDRVSRCVDDAIMLNVGSVRIIHGKGTGALRAAVHQCLKTNPSVKSYRLGAYGEGEAGVTVVELK